LGFFFTLWYFINETLFIINGFLTKFINGFVFSSMMLYRFSETFLKYPFIAFLKVDVGQINPPTPVIHFAEAYETVKNRH
jgi:hypothetical protein